MLFDGDRSTTFARVPRRCASAPRPGSHALGVGDGHERLVAAARRGRSRRCSSARCAGSARSRTRCCRSTATARSSFIAKQTQLQAARSRRRRGTTSTTRRSPSRSRARTTACTRSSPTTTTPKAIPRRCRRRPRSTTIPAQDPVRWIFYTSGTTADPKGAQHTDRSVLAGAIGYAEKTHVVADDIALVAFPFTHVGGIIIGVFTPLLTGSAAVLMEAWTARGVDRADRPAPRDARERRGRDPHRAARGGARRTPTRTRRCATSRAAARRSRRTCTTS